MILTVTLNPSVDVWLDVPKLKPGAFHRIAQVSRSAGGKGLNVSRVIHNLGGPTLALAVAGGTTGMELKRLLAEHKTPARILANEGPARINYKVREIQNAQTTELNTPGPRISQATRRRLTVVLERLLLRAHCVVFAGNIPSGLAAAFYRDWIIQARRVKVPAVLDASGEALRLGLTGKPWLVKPNQEEAEQLLGFSIRSLKRAKKAVKAFCGQGASVTLLSLGESGALLAVRNSSDTWLAVPPRVRLNSTVGSGDALLAGSLHALASGRSWPEALVYGVACGSASAQNPAGIFSTARETAKLYSRVRLKRY